MNKNLPFNIFFYISSFFMFIFSSHWFTVWVCLELNTLMIVSLMMKNKKEMESALIYFLTQSLSSMVIIFFIFSNSSDSLASPMCMTSMMLIICMVFKTGAMPFSSWFISTLSNMNNTMFFLLLTFQKLMPFMLILLLTPSNLWEIFMIIILSLLMGPILNFSASNLKMILIFSSISHVGWFLLALNMNTPIWMFYFFMYSIIVFFATLLMMNNKTALLQKKTTKMMLMLVMMTLAGLPPLIMFIPKVSIIMISTLNYMWAMVTVLLLSAMVDFFIYLRICYGVSLIYYCKIVWLKQKTVKPLPMLLSMLMPTLMLSMF